MVVSTPNKITELDLTQAKTFVDRDLTAFWTQLRQHAPVAWHPSKTSGFWVLSRYSDIVNVFRDSETFSSARGNVLDVLLQGGDPAGGKMLPLTDGEKHAQCRRELLKSFHSRILKEIHTGLKQSIVQLISPAISASHCDIASEVAPFIPLTAISDLLGVPEADRKKLLGFTSTALSAETPDANPMKAILARNELLLYFSTRINQTQTNINGELFERILSLRQSPFELSDEEIIYNCYSFMLGGDETARLTIISMVKLLCEHPELWQQLKQEQIDLDKVVDEFLRYITPAMHFGRYTTRDTELAGVEIKAGDIVTVWLSSANFDPERFDEPQSIQFNRASNKHLTFGYGPHFCIGAQLARVELKAFLEVLLAMVDSMELLEQPKPIYSNCLRGYWSCPVRLVGAAS